ncbi:hypothetical protein EXE58_02380 [Nocardioides seonyuensis]|uniref:Uncharacterized protein n=1 Tax=Nocardioides seonyuensis TaxID=2518371 RepID=A0A4P7IEQ5_9ACTN|nr:hypothetical protein [Nocardioides seonyuensis]QBX54427.1 hypothetical protein EXE58_02380 [Nocardioides seonyuensis]
MPESHARDLDLDEAFDSLARDLGARPGAPGASAAVATVRRRRRTTLAAVGAAVAVVVAAVALPQLTGGTSNDERRDVATTGDGAVFTGAAFSDATDGWTGPWHEATKGDSMEEVAFGQAACLDQLRGAGTNVTPRRFGDVVLVSETGRSAAFVTFGEFRTAADAATVIDMYAPSALEDACGVVPDVSTVGSTEARHLHVPDGSSKPAADVWLAFDGPRIAMLAVVAPDAAPAEVQERVAELLDRAMDADISFESSMTRVEEGSGDSASSSDVVPYYTPLTRAAVARATGGWPARVTTSSELPCTATFPLSAQSWGSASSARLGFTTSQAGLETEDAARASVDEVADTLASCQRAAWAVTTGTLRGDRTLSASSAEGTFVLAQRGATLAWVAIGEPDAPEPAVQAIASLLHDTLAVGGDAEKR